MVEKVPLFNLFPTCISYFAGHFICKADLIMKSVFKQSLYHCKSKVSVVAYGVSVIPCDLSFPGFPIDFLSWFLNSIHITLNGTKKPNSSKYFNIKCCC